MFVFGRLLSLPLPFGVSFFSTFGFFQPLYDFLFFLIFIWWLSIPSAESAQRRQKNFYRHDDKNLFGRCRLWMFFFCIGFVCKKRLGHTGCEKESASVNYRFDLRINEQKRQEKTTHPLWMNINYMYVWLLLHNNVAGTCNFFPVYTAPFNHFIFSHYRVDKQQRLHQFWSLTFHVQYTIHTTAITIHSIQWYIRKILIVMS